MDLEDYRQDLLNQTHIRAAAEGVFTKEAFLGEVADRLAEAEEIEQLNVVWFEGEGKRRRKLAVHGFDLNDSDNSVALAVLRWGGQEFETFSYTEAKSSLKALQGFLEEAVNGEFQAGREPSSPEYQLAEDIRTRGRNVSRYRLYLLSDLAMSESARVVASTELNGIPIDFHIWDVRRLHQVAESLTGRQELVIDLTEWIPEGLPALEVVANSSDTKTYLAALPSRMLADLYERHGSRLLEGNVRSYLSNRGKVNKSIRTTILSDPAHFLAYNNGITATAMGVDLKDGRIAKFRDLQIVNGGQTTASIFYVRRDSRAAPLDDVYVQMKLVVVEPEVASDMIPLISRYANSQNKVNEADFFSNSPFHIRIQELSHRVVTPPKPGVSFQTHWFYERTRGSYQNEKSKLTVAKQKKFEQMYPKSQVIDKTAAAKYEVTWGMQPHVVSSGAQKNFVAFANLVAQKWEAAPDAFNELYWKRLVAKALLYESLRTAIAKADWYQKGYLANYVTYALAKLSFEIGRQANGRVFNFDAVWESQAVSVEVINECLAIAQKVQGVLTSDSRGVQNVTEWAKREACWFAVCDVNHQLSGEVLSKLQESSVEIVREKEAKSRQKIDTAISLQMRVMSMQASEWVAVEQFLRQHKLLSPDDVSILKLVNGSRPAVPTDRQAKRLVNLHTRAIETGFGMFG